MRRILLCMFFAHLTIASFAQNTIAQDLKQRAFTNSWNHKFAEAIADFNEYLSQNPGDVDARNGLGYTYGWSGQYENARNEFNTVLTTSPGNMDAQKGLAYTALWSGRSREAIDLFDRLIQTSPKDEYYIAKANAYVQLNQLKNARASLQQVLSKDPSNRDAINIRNSLRLQPGLVEVDALAGLTRFDGENETGLRLVQIAVQPTARLRLMGKYDNTLSLDNVYLINRDATAPYYGGGISYTFPRISTTRIEYGARNIKNSSKSTEYTEKQITLDQAFYFKNSSINGGAAWFRQADSTAGWLITAGFHQNIGKSFVGGLQFFHSERNATQTQEDRFLLTGEVHLNAVSLTGGVFGGWAKQDRTLPSSVTNTMVIGSVFGTFLKAYIPVGNYLGFHLMVGNENNYTQNFLVAQAGIRIRIEK